MRRFALFASYIARSFAFMKKSVGFTASHGFLRGFLLFLTRKYFISLIYILQNIFSLIYLITERVNMKTKIWIIAGMLIIAFAAMAVPVMAADASSSVNVSGTIAKTASLTASNSGEGSITLTPGSTTDLISVHLTASQNCVGSITAVDAMTPSKPAGTAGYMANWTGTSYSATATKLIHMMGLVGSDATGYTHASQITDLSTESPLYTITAAESATQLNLDFSQQTETTDLTLPGTNSYRIPVAFALTCT
jgi:hypothetical protein